MQNDREEERHFANLALRSFFVCAAWVGKGEEGREGGKGYSQENCMELCGPLPKTLTQFMTKIYDFPHPT